MHSAEKKFYSDTNFILDYGACDLFFSFLEIIPESLAIIRSGEERNYQKFENLDTHPPAALRRNKLSSFVKQNFGDTDAYNAIKWGRLIEGIVQTL
ncbi:MAG: hypothetical protein M3P08_19215 [Thermoproteota archaeon]|nr:hypothetical protein [Thermoproteota archaeon]